MANITVKNIPTELYEQLKTRAEVNRRSINNEIIYCIELAVRSTRPEPGVMLESARSIREKTRAYTTNDEEFTQAKRTGRQ